LNWISSNNTLCYFYYVIYNYYNIQNTDSEITIDKRYLGLKQWPQELPKSETMYLQAMSTQRFHDNNDVVWVRLNEYEYPGTALYLPER
jgi:hypothetical protein